MVEKIREILIHNIVRLREGQGLSQEALAERARLNATHISQIETGRRWPKPSTVDALAYGLGVSVSELFLDISLPKYRPTAKECADIISEFVKEHSK